MLASSRPNEFVISTGKARGEIRISPVGEFPFPEAVLFEENVGITLVTKNVSDLSIPGRRYCNYRTNA
jgi:hypothetical protein